ncbi:MAG TPA: NADH-quinone oxidoreductase subunit L [Tepidisphaeraceae bacterium]|jgi:NADH-quinone oxidoreductase subunit L|nr:NADH-quinone oxidoreductase subunit L [Tepidisphaeraceae bacterium]
MEGLFAVRISYLIPLLPLIGAIVAGFLGARWLKEKSHWPIWIGVGLSAVLSFVLLFGMIGKWPGHAAAVPKPGEEVSLETRVLSTQLKAMAMSVNWYRWIEAGDFKVEAGALIDPLTAVMLCVVCGIGLLITIFAAGYMKGEKGYFRFFAYLGLFIFAMTVLVMANNFVLLYLGWEGVGLCSYLLIGFYFERPAAREAAKKAFLVNRIGDFGFGLGIMLIFVIFGTVSFFGDGAGTNSGVLELAIPGGNFLGALEPWKRQAIPWIPFLLMLGAFGKSAQFPLYVWLPDAMEGPTPVSALIHAATMVTAGVYMIVRCGTLFVPNSGAMFTIATIGTFTAIFAAVIALRQFDLKKVFAYSTISQLGFMFAAVGLWSPVPGIFHLVTHAFFKALLFLSSGVVMHAMLGHLDMRKMSGLRKVLPKTHLLMLGGCLALAGVPIFAGFWSKDEILVSAWVYNKGIFLVLLFTAFLTAYYTFRLYFRVFQGPVMVPTEAAEGHAHGHDEEHGHEPVDEHLQGQAHAAAEHSHEPAIMIWPLVVLAVGAALAGFLNWPEREKSLGGFLGESPSLILAHLATDARYNARFVLPVPFGAEEMELKAVRDQMHSVHVVVAVLSILAAGLGIYSAYSLHLKNRSRGEELVARYPGLTRALEAKFWVDEVYQAAVVEPLRGLGRLFYAIDRYVVDGIVWMVGFVPQLFGFTLKLSTQRGSLQGYAVTMLLAVVVILLVLFL